jgi:uncharacterized protein with PIN domain
MEAYVDDAVKAMLQKALWPKFKPNMDSHVEQTQWEHATAKRLKEEIRTELTPEIQAQLTPDIAKSLRVELEREAFASSTARLNERLEGIVHQMEILLTDWQSMHNSAAMGAIRSFGKGGHHGAREVVQQSSHLLTRAKALGRCLTEMRDGVGMVEQDGAPAAKRQCVEIRSFFKRAPKKGDSESASMQ